MAVLVAALLVTVVIPAYSAINLPDVASVALTILPPLAVYPNGYISRFPDNEGVNVLIPTSATNEVVDPTLVITASPFITLSLAPAILTFSSTSRPCVSTVLIVASPTTLS